MMAEEEKNKIVCAAEHIKYRKREALGACCAKQTKPGL
jgi:hypothetical protein